MQNWHELDDAAQLALREAYQLQLDSTPRTCSLEEKVARFSAWLAGRGVVFDMDDLKPR